MVQQQIPISELPFNFDGLEGVYGCIRYAMLECPGVYYIQTGSTSGRPLCGAEYFAVTDGFPAISEKIQSYGIPLQTNPHILLYDCEDYFNQGKAILEYEVHKYLVENGFHLPEGVSLREDEVRGMEICPEYFGEFPVPTETPWGNVLRYDRLWNGLFWLKSEKAGWVLALAYPICDDLSDLVKDLGQLTDYDAKVGIKKTYGYRFYTYKLSCLPIFELSLFAEETWRSKINMAALKNILLDSYPNYAMSNSLVSPTPSAGYDFYNFPND